MIYAILSDIHANLCALETVLRHAEKQGVQRFLCLGDTVGYGPQPNECCEIVRALDPVIVRGNHDAAAVTPGVELWFTPAAKTCILWTRELLSQENRDFLLALPPAEVEDDAHLCHGALFDPDYYTTTTREAAASMQVMSLPLCFFGHTHYAEWFVSNGDEALPEQFPAPQGDEIRLQPGNAYMINPGSVGQPRDGNSQAGYAIWDTEAQTVVLHRVSYNVSATQRKMDDEGLPRSMSERLMMGV